MTDERPGLENIDAFIRATVDKVYSIMYGIVGSKEEAEDLTQETYMKVLKGLPAFRGDASPETWLYRIAVNTGRDAIARRIMERRRDGGEVDPSLPSGVDDPSANLLRGEEADAVRSAVAALADEWREAIVLVEIEGISVAEAARVLDVPEGTVKSRLFRGREKLRQSLRHYYGGSR